MRAALLAVALLLAAAAPAAAAPDAGQDRRLLAAGARRLAAERPARVRGREGRRGEDRRRRHVPRRARACTEQRDEERGLLSIAFPPDYATSGLFYVFLTAQPAPATLQVLEFRALGATRTAPTPRRHAVPVDPAPGRDEPQRRPAPVRAGRLLYVEHRRRRRRRRRTRRTSTRARQDPAARRRAPAPRRRATRHGRGLVVRAAQPVAVHVRPRDRRPGDRRRRRRTTWEEVDWAPAAAAAARA